jgi:hypothetical protein
MMAIEAVCGWESGVLSAESLTTAGTVSVQSSVARGGTYALRVNPTTIDVGYARLTPSHEAAGNGNFSSFLDSVVHLRFAFRVATGGVPSSGDEGIISLGTGVAEPVEIRLNSSRQLVMYNSAGLVETGSTALTLDQWYELHILVTDRAASGAYAVKINGVTELSGTMDTAAGGDALQRIFVGKYKNRNGNSVDFYYDDFVADIDGSEVPSSDGLAALIPNADGVDTDWTAGTGATWAETDERPIDNGTTYLQSTAENDAHTVNFTSTASAGIGAGDTIRFVAITPLVARAASNSNADAKMRSGASEVNANVSTLVNSDVYGSLAGSIIRTVDPATAVAWTIAGVDAVQGGVIDTDASGNRTRCTAVLCYVDVLSVAGGEDLSVTLHEPIVGRSALG